MNNENMKNMVVLKDIPSNIVEEAIIIFNFYPLLIINL